MQVITATSYYTWIQVAKWMQCFKVYNVMAFNIKHTDADVSTSLEVSDGMSSPSSVSSLKG